MSDITLRCMNGFTVHAKGSNIVVESKRKEETYPISKIQSFALKEPRALRPCLKKDRECAKATK